MRIKYYIIGTATIIFVFLLSVIMFNIDWNSGDSYTLDEIENIPVDIDTNTKLEIRDQKLFDSSNNEEIMLTSNSVMNEYKPIYSKDFDKYSFVVYSKAQDKLVDNCLVYEKYRNYCPGTFIYVISKITGRGTVIDEVGTDLMLRLDLDTLQQISDDRFILEAKDIYSNELIDIINFVIYDQNDILLIGGSAYFNKFFIIDSRIEKLKKYFIASDYNIFYYEDEIEAYKWDLHYEVDIEYYDGKALVTSSSYGGSRNDIDVTNKTYLLDGYVTIINNMIYYLDNDLIVKELGTDKEYYKLSQIEDWDNIILRQGI